MASGDVLDLPAEEQELIQRAIVVHANERRLRGGRDAWGRIFFCHEALGLFDDVEAEVPGLTWNEFEAAVETLDGTIRQRRPPPRAGFRPPSRLRGDGRAARLEVWLPAELVIERRRPA